MTRADTRFCWSCGYPLETDFMFCDLCGAPVEQSDVPDTVSSAGAAGSENAHTPVAPPPDTNSPVSWPAPSPDGPPPEQAAAAETTGSSPRGLWIAGGCAATILLVAIAVGTTGGGGSEQLPAMVNEQVHVPEDAPTLAWSAHARGHASVLADSDMLYLLDGGDRPELVAHRSRNGDERWRTSVPTSRSGTDSVWTDGWIVDDIIVTSSGTIEDKLVAGIDAGVGDVIWEQRVAGTLFGGPRDPRSDDEHLYLRENISGSQRVTRIDPRDGSLGRSYRAPSVTVREDAVLAVDGDEVTLLDPVDLEPLGPPLRASGPVGWVIPFRQGVLAVVGQSGQEDYAFVTGDVEYLTEDEQPHQVTGLRSRTTTYIIALGGARALIAGDAGVEVVDIDDGRAEPVWGDSGGLHSLCRAGHDVVVLVSGRDWTSLNVHDVDTGDRRGSMAYRSPEGDWFGPLSDVLCGEATLATFTDTNTIEAVGLDGRRLWDLRIPGSYVNNVSFRGADSHLIVTSYHSDVEGEGETLFEVYE